MAERGSFAKPYDTRDVQRSRAETTLMSTAIDLRRQANTWRAAAHIQSTDSLWPVHLVCGKGCQIDSESFDIEWNLPNNLCRIRVEDDAAFAEALVALARQQRPDVLVLSGDITQRARPAQFDAARAFTDRLGAPVLAVPNRRRARLLSNAATSSWTKSATPAPGRGSASP